MSGIIIVCGLPGAGKTFFAQRLAQSIKAVHINSDSMRSSDTALHLILTKSGLPLIKVIPGLNARSYF